MDSVIAMDDVGGITRGYGREWIGYVDPFLSSSRDRVGPDLGPRDADRG
ncbi:hypothetical protein NJ7G_1013 [Natrinema sp. J7-2]|nr:hypothetical protein NJ7G_1013 [Natrinema sp. J7-2]